MEVKGVGDIYMDLVDEFYAKRPATWRDLLLKLIFAKIPPKCGCNELAEEMDNGGVRFCLKERERIIEHVTDNAIRGSRMGIGKLFRPEIRSQVGSWLLEAIARHEKQFSLY